MSLPISSFMSSEHVFYRLARFNSSSRRYFNSSPILQAESNYSLCSPNQTLTGWGMTSHWEPIKLKLIHKNSTYPLYPQKSSQLALIYSSPAAQSSLRSASTPNSTMVHRTRPASWVHVSELTFSGPVTTANLLLPWPFCSNHHHSQIWVYDSFLSFCCEHICQFYMTLPKVAPVPNSPVASS